MRPSRFRAASLFSWLVFGLVAPWMGAMLGAAEPWPLDTPPIDAKLRQLIEDRNYPAAIQAIDEAIRAPQAPRDYLAYLKGWTLHLAKQYDAAIAVFDAMEKEFGEAPGGTGSLPGATGSLPASAVAGTPKPKPRSEWLHRARFAKAMALARKGDFRGAELIYRAQADRLLSVERRQQIAEVYLEFAFAHFKPAKEGQQPDYAKALEYFDQALAVGPKPERRIEVELSVAQCYQKTDNFAEAAKWYARFLEDHPASPAAMEARFSLGECRLAEGNLKGARRVWQDLLAKHGDAPSPRIAEAAYRVSRTWRIPTPQTDEELDLGTAALAAFVERFPKHEQAGMAQLEIAQSLAFRKRYADAAVRLERFLKDPRMQGRKEIADGWFLLGQAYQLQKKFPEAVATWREYLAKFPAHGRSIDAQQEIIHVEYRMGLEKYQAKDYAGAVKLLGEFLAKYPLDSRGPDVLLLFGRIEHEQKRFDAAIAAWRRLISKHPDTEEAAYARFMIARTLERDLGRLEEALEEYRTVGGGSCQGEAQKSIARLTAATMRVSSPRAFRSNETPKLVLVTRNVEAVTVRSYKLDLETYFRKTHQVQGIGQLDIGLIDPDVTFEFKVPGYAKHRETTSHVEVPLPEKGRSGVMAVTVGYKNVEATALVVQSDLELVTKTSRDEVFAFAENMVTGKPWPGVRVLVSDGKKILAEATTGPQGVLQQSLAGVERSDRVAVLAVADGHAAFSEGLRRGDASVRGLLDKGYLLTDQPVYRAGQQVQVRACLRPASADGYSVEPGKKYTLDVYDSRNRPVHRAELVLGAFGTFQDRFVLPVTAPQGRYRLVARDAGRTFQGTFEVQPYKQELVRLAIDAPQRVYYRGDSIEGTIRATFYDGTPLVGRQVGYQLAGEIPRTGRTDARGEVRFQFPTREYDESQNLLLTASLPDENLRAEAGFVLATRGFGIALSTTRPVFLAGEPFELTVLTRDAAGMPIGQKLTMKVLERTLVDGKAGERLLAEHPLQTAAVDGSARQTLKLDKGGAHRLRVEGVDRFKNPVSAQLEVLISDDKDDTRLRILADRHTFKAGETAQFRVVWRGEPALALVTLEGARVMDYQLVELKTGLNPLAIPMVPRWAPNFELAVAVMTDPRPDPKQPDPKQPDRQPATTRFHEASVPVSVERDLSVKLAVRRQGATAGPIRPGEQLDVLLTTTDPLGRPVAAEVSLAMVEEALLSRHPWPVGPIQDFFRGPRREGSVPTASSITFSDAPATRPVNPRLLAEQDRQQVAADEEASRRIPWPAAQALAGAVPGEPPDLPAVTSGNVQLAGVLDAMRGLGSEGLTPEENLEATALATESAGIPAMAAGGMGGSFGGALAKTRSGRSTTARASRPAAAAPQPPQAPGPAGQAQTATILPPDVPVPETAYWNPAIATGKEGTATVRVVVPDRSTTWSLTARGITAETLAGEAVERLAVKKDFYVELKLPRAFTDGDEAAVPVTVHNGTIDQGPIEVALRTTIDGRTIEEKKTIEVKSQGLCELAFKVVLRRPEKPVQEKAASTAQTSVLFELSAAGKGAADALRRSVPLVPYGAPVFAAVSGSADADTTVWVELPKALPVSSPQLQILVGPTVERGMLDVLFGPESACRAFHEPLASPVETATSDLLAALALQKLLAASRDSGHAQAAALDARASLALTALVAAQESDGGWSWTGLGGSSNPYGTARVVWAIERARQAGYPVRDEAFSVALGYLQARLAALDAKDLQTKAILLHALTVAGKGEFSPANQLHRQRLQLSPVALAYLALTLVEMDRKPMAGEVLDVLARRGVDSPSPSVTAAPSPAPDEVAPGGDLPDCHAPIEVRALWAIAAQAVSPKAPKTKQLIDGLLAARSGNRWTPDRATGPAAVALAAWFGENRFQGEHYKLAVSVNGTAVRTLEVDPSADTQVIDVPAALVSGPRQKIAFQLSGRGRYTYQGILGGLVPADKLTGTTKEWTVSRTYEPAPREVDGRELARGFYVLRTAKGFFRNPMTQLPVGRRGLVELFIGRPTRGPEPADDPRDYLVITEPIPSGAEVIESSVTGTFDRFEIGPGAITFYVGSIGTGRAIRYQLHGYLPGAFRASPTIVRNAYRPEQMAVGTPASLAVLPLGAATTDPYRLSPGELLDLGKQLRDKKDLKAAAEHLGELFAGWDLTPEVYKQVVEMLLDLHLELGPPEKVVQYFEIVKEKWPETEIPFAKIVKVGAAYDRLGELERSYLVFRATVESSFTRDGGVVGFLQSQGEFVRSVDYLSRLVREYPPEPYVAEAEYGLAQQVAAKAPEAASDPKLRQQKINRIDLMRRSWGMLEDFLTIHPEDPAADQAAFAAANVLLDLKDFPAASAACRRAAARYPQSSLLDAFWYLDGYCQFALGNHQEALELCRKVADARRADPKTGKPGDSPNKWRAIYMMGQIYHRLGQPAEAMREYRRVADRSSDARQTVAHFLRKAIELPEITSIRPGTPAEVEIKFRNLAACDLRVYRIDLMKYTVLKGDLAGITRINLAGIRPLYEAAVKLGEGNDYRDRTHKLELPLKKEGAYLVVCRGDDFHASGLVLVTPLALEVETDRTAGQVRTMVKDTVTGRYLTGVHVKVIGSGNEQFLSGEPDLRGIFVADGVRGAATVIAQSEPGRYAFYREVSARPAEQPSASEQAEASGQAKPPRSDAPKPKPKDVAEVNPFDEPETPRPRVARKGPPAPEPGRAARRTPQTPAPARAVDMGGLGPSESERRIREALKSPTEIDFVDTRLTDAIQVLKQRHGIEIQFDEAALEELRIATDTPITRRVSGVSLRSALQLMLRELGLSYVIKDEVLLITSPDAAESADFMKTTIYPVRDLVLPRGSTHSGPGMADFDALIELIQNTVATDTWQDVGGAGTIEPFEPNLSLVLSQTQEGHEEIEDLLDRLRRAARGDTVAHTPESVRAIQAALDAPVRVEFHETPLAEVANRLAGEHKIQVQLDRRALEELGVAPNIPVTRSLAGVTLRSALDLILKPLGLTHTVQDDVVLITSPDTAQSPEFLRTVVYPVADLAAFRDPSSGEQWADYEALIEIIQNTVATDTWQDIGGAATIEPFENGRALAISQTYEVHREVAQLLERLRSTGGTTAGSGPRLRVKPLGSFGFGGMGGMGGGMGGMIGGIGGMGGGMPVPAGMGGMPGPEQAGASGGMPAGYPGSTPSGLGGRRGGRGGRGMGPSPTQEATPAAAAKRGGPAAGTQAGARPASPAAAASGSIDLLEGVRDAHKAQQEQQLQRLEKRYKKGSSGGMPGGMGGMGGMGGVGAGGAY